MRQEEHKEGGKGCCLTESRKSEEAKRHLGASHPLILLYQPSTCADVC